LPSIVSEFSDAGVGAILNLPGVRFQIFDFHYPALLVDREGQCFAVPAAVAASPGTFTGTRRPSRSTRGGRPGEKIRSLIFPDELNMAINNAGVDGSVSRLGAAAAPPTTTVAMFLSSKGNDEQIHLHPTGQDRQNTG
jgi:hypothetical protein